MRGLLPLLQQSLVLLLRQRYVAREEHHAIGGLAISGNSGREGSNEEGKIERVRRWTAGGGSDLTNVSITVESGGPSSSWSRSVRWLRARGETQLRTDATLSADIVAVGLSLMLKSMSPTRICLLSSAGPYFTSDLTSWPLTVFASAKPTPHPMSLTEAVAAAIWPSSGEELIIAWGSDAPLFVGGDDCFSAACRAETMQFCCASSTERHAAACWMT